MSRGSNVSGFSADYFGFFRISTTFLGLFAIPPLILHPLIKDAVILHMLHIL